jgi:hypothetical protein
MGKLDVDKVISELSLNEKVALTAGEWMIAPDIIPELPATTTTPS